MTCRHPRMPTRKPGRERVWPLARKKDGEPCCPTWVSITHYFNDFLWRRHVPFSSAIILMFVDWDAPSWARLTCTGARCGLTPAERQQNWILHGSPARSFKFFQKIPFIKLNLVILLYCFPGSFNNNYWWKLQYCDKDDDKETYRHTAYTQNIWPLSSDSQVCPK